MKLSHPTLSRALPLAAYGLVLASPTYAAQINSLTSGMTWITTTLTGIAVAVITIAVIWVGFKVLFQHARLADVAHIIIGGVLIGGASAVASAVYGGSAGG